MARHHGSGTLVKRGKWYTAKWMVDGKVYTKSTRCANRRDALERDDFLKALILKGGSLSVADVQKARESAEIDEMTGDVFGRDFK